MLMGGYEFVVAGQFIGMLANVWAQHRNARDSQAFQEKNLEKSARNQRDNIEFQATQQAASQAIQQRHQWMLQQESYKQQVANQMRAYDLQNSWPLSTSPSTIADMITGCKGNLPLFLVVAPEEKTGIQKELYSVWTNIRNYFMTTFGVNSDTPVIEGGYKVNFPVEPTQDYMKIYTGLKGIPTLYLAPYQTNRDRVLGVTMAFWGRGDGLPVAQNIELDLRKLYVDTIREESIEYRRHCEDGSVVFDEKSPMAKNNEVFLRENENVPFDYRDQSLQMYNTLKPTPATFSMMSAKIYPVLQLVSVGVVDSYFTLGYGTEPKFPKLVAAVRAKGRLPDLSLRDAQGNAFDVKGDEFVDEMDSRYTGLVLLDSRATSGSREIEESSPCVPEDRLSARGGRPFVAPFGANSGSRSFF